MALAVAWAVLFFDAWRLGQPLTLRRLTAGRRSASTASSASRSPRCCCSARTWSACSATSSRPCSAPATPRRPRRPLQRAAHGRRLRRRPLGAAAGLDDGRQHRRRDRQDGAGLAAAQHAELPVPPRARSCTSSSRRASTARHCMLNGVDTWALDNKGAVRQGSKTPASTPRSGRRGDHRPEDELLGDGQPQGLRDLVDAVGGVTVNVRQRDPDRRPRLGRLRLHRAGQAEADRLRDPVVRAGPRRLRRLLPHGAPEVRDGRDARPAQPATVLKNFQQIAQASLGDGADEHPGQRGGPLHRAGARRPESQKVATLSIVPPMFDTYEPDAT